MYDALYARQSVEKVDSISIESQLEYCKYEVRGEPFKEYIDRGYSGKNTNRPAFEALIYDICHGKISRVIVYKLDRISRSILDFTNMMEIFEKNNVQFISSTERFDTSTPIGRAMLNICIVFAQLERETIQKRVKDSYYSRCKRGLYMGGRVPYGFTKTETVIDGIKTAMYIPVKEEVEQIQIMYSLYSDTKNSLGDIIAYFNKNQIKQLRGGMWNTARISEILRNPVYVQADVEIYQFLKDQGANIINPVSDFIGYNGCYLYKGTLSDSCKQRDLADREVVIAPHQGIVSSREWLKCRLRCLNNRQSTKTCKPKNSWLLGKIKCGKCGYGLTVVKSHTKWHKYFVCSTSLSTKKEKCHGTGSIIYVDILENYLMEAIEEKLGEYDKISDVVESDGNCKLNRIKIRLEEIKKEMEDLISKVSQANNILLDYINKKLEVLDIEYKSLSTQLENLQYEKRKQSIHVISDHIGKWKDTTLEEKQEVVDVLIKVITVADGRVKIIWNI